MRLACAGDSQLIMDVERLLEVEDTASWCQEPTLPGRIGRYKVLEVLGEGGMGIVYLAEQEEPVRRRVALKVIKLGMDTREVVARFQAEQQALAPAGRQERREPRTELGGKAAEAPGGLTTS